MSVNICGYSWLLVDIGECWWMSVDLGGFDLLLDVGIILITYSMDFFYFLFLPVISCGGGPSNG